MACRFLNVSTSGYYDWASRPPSLRAVADAALTTTIRRIHADSRKTYGAPRVLAELRLGLGIHVARKRVARLMRLDGLVGVSHRGKRRGWKPDTATHEDLVKRRFRADAPNRLWFCDITQHRAKDGWVYCAAVIDAYSRRIVGWSISDRITAEIVVDALEMARWRRRPEPGTIVHADRGAQYTSWLFGHRLRRPGLLGSMGRVASGVDNALIEMLLSVSSGCRSAFEESEEEAGVVALEATHGLALGLALGDSACKVVTGLGVGPNACENGGVDHAVELTVAAAREPMPGLSLAGGRG